MRSSVAAVPDMPTAGAAEARSFDDWVEQELAAAVAAFVVVEHDTVGRLRDACSRPRADERSSTASPACSPSTAAAAWRPRSAERRSPGRPSAATRSWSPTTGVSNTALRRQKAKLGYDERDGPIVVRGAV